MSNAKQKAAAAKAKAPQTVVSDDPADRKGQLRNIGGSPSDPLNNMLANQAMQALWVKNSSPEERERHLSATIAALIGIAPKDELEGMLAAQLVASHNAAMECYRRAMIGEQTLAGRSENLAQANKLSRTYSTLLEALNRHRGKGQQKVTVEHVHIHAGGQAVVGNVSAAPGGGSEEKPKDQSHALAYAPGVEMLREVQAERAEVPSAGGEGPANVSNARGDGRSPSRQSKRPQARPVHGGVGRIPAGDEGLVESRPRNAHENG